MALLWGLALCLGRGRIGSDLADAVGGWEGGISPGDGLSIHSEKVRVCGGLKTCLGWKNYRRFVCCFHSKWLQITPQSHEDQPLMWKAGFVSLLFHDGGGIAVSFTKRPPPMMSRRRIQTGDQTTRPDRYFSALSTCRPPRSRPAHKEERG